MPLSESSLDIQVKYSFFRSISRLVAIVLHYRFYCCLFTDLCFEIQAFRWLQKILFIQHWLAYQNSIGWVQKVLGLCVSIYILRLKKYFTHSIETFLMFVFYAKNSTWSWLSKDVLFQIPVVNWFFLNKNPYPDTKIYRVYPQSVTQAFLCQLFMNNLSVGVFYAFLICKNDSDICVRVVGCYLEFNNFMEKNDDMVNNRLIINKRQNTQ